MSSDEMNNPFKTLRDIYKDGVDKENGYGYSNVYKRATKRFLDEVSEYCNEYGHFNINIVDLVYEDGYFICGMGKNSVVKFRVKEVPGFLFGIWWDHDEGVKYDKTKDGKISGKLFAQYEDDIDKFKPSRSKFLVEFEVRWIGGKSILFTENAYDAYRMIRFMVEEPDLSWARHHFGWNYNWEYHTREEAEEEKKKYIEFKEREEIVTAELNERCVSAVRNALSDEIEAGVTKILDSGDHCNPRYEIVVDQSSFNKKDKPSVGSYLLIWEDDIVKKMTDEFERCKEEAKGEEFCWWCPFDEVCTVVEHKYFKKMKNFWETDK